MLSLFKKSVYLRANARVEDRSIYLSLYPADEEGDGFNMDDGLTMKLGLTEAAQLALGVRKGKKVRFIHDASLAGGKGSSVLSFGLYKDTFFLTISKKTGKKKARKLAFPLDSHELYLLYLYLDETIRDLIRERPYNGRTSTSADEDIEDEEEDELPVGEEDEEEFDEEPPFPKDMDDDVSF